MADSDLEIELGGEPIDEAPAPEKSPKKKRGGGIFSAIASNKMAILQTAIAVVILGALGFWIYLMKAPPKQPIQASASVAGQGEAGAGETGAGEAGESHAGESEAEDEEAGSGEQAAESIPAVPAREPEAEREMSASEAMKIAALRSELRRENRSDRNQAFSKRMDDGDMLRISIRGELALLSSMFSHYVSTTAKFYELFRIMANDYVARREQVLEIFEKELMPEYIVTERRRRMMRRRVEHDPAVELYDRLDYIAYHDSIAVDSFREFIEKGGEEQFAQTSDLVSESKFMIEDFRQRLEVRLRDYDMKVEVPETVWQKYFGSWPW